MPLQTALLIAAAVLVAATAIGLVLRSRDGRRRSGGGLQVRPEDAELGGGVTLVQFSTELCARCPQVRRMLRSIAAQHPGVAHAEVDLTDRTDLATRYHVLQTPTTFLVDASGSVLSRWGGVPHRETILAALGAAPALQEES